MHVLAIQIMHVLGVIRALLFEILSVVKAVSFEVILLVLAAFQVMVHICATF